MSADLEKLLPCPFCGGEAHLSRYHAYSTDSSFDFVGCKACYALIMCEDGRDGKAEAISEWNRRAPDLARQVIALTADNAALRAKSEKLAEAVRHERELACQDIGMQIEASNAVEAALTEWETP